MQLEESKLSLPLPLLSLWLSFLFFLHLCVKQLGATSQGILGSMSRSFSLEILKVSTWNNTQKRIISCWPCIADVPFALNNLFISSLLALRSRLSPNNHWKLVSTHDPRFVTSQALLGAFWVNEHVKQVSKPEGERDHCGWLFSSVNHSLRGKQLTK